MRATRPYGVRPSTAVLGALLALAACSPAPEPETTSVAIQTATVDTAALELRGILWPNLILLDGDTPMQFSEDGERPPPAPSRFRIHLDVKLADQAELDSLRVLLQAAVRNEVAIRELLKNAAGRYGANASVSALIDAVPYDKNNGGLGSPWPRHEVFIDRGTSLGLTYWYRMELDLKIPAAQSANIASLLSGSDKPALVAAVHAVGVPAQLKPLVDAIAIRP